MVCSGVHAVIAVYMGNMVHGTCSKTQTRDQQGASMAETARVMSDVHLKRCMMCNVHLQRCHACRYARTG